MFDTVPGVRPLNSPKRWRAGWGARDAVRGLATHMPIGTGLFVPHPREWSYQGVPACRFPSERWQEVLGTLRGTPPGQRRPAPKKHSHAQRIRPRPRGLPEQRDGVGKTAPPRDGEDRRPRGAAAEHVVAPTTRRGRPARPQPARGSCPSRDVHGPSATRLRGQRPRKRSRTPPQRLPRAALCCFSSR